MFQESMDIMSGDTWFDCLDEEFGENHIWSGEDLTKWQNMSKRERGLWLTGVLWNDTNIMPGSLCSELDLPQGSTYACGVRKLRDDFRQEFLPENLTAA
jgi:hypothetical protein